MKSIETYNTAPKIPFSSWEKHPDGTPGGIFHYRDVEEARMAWELMKCLGHPAVELDSENARVLSYSDGRAIA